MQRGNCSRHMLAQGPSGKVDSTGPPLTGSLPVSVRVSLPQLGPTPLQGGAFGKPRATDGAAQPGSGPCRTPLLIQGPRGVGSFPRARPSLMEALVTSPSWLSDKPIPPLTQPWRVFSPLTGSTKRTNACQFSKLATI